MMMMEDDDGGEREREWMVNVGSINKIMAYVAARNYT